MEKEVIENRLAKMPKPMKFNTFRIADIGTEFLEESDLDLLSSAPNHLANTDGEYGDFFHVPSDDDYMDYFREQVAEHGLSGKFMAIFEELFRQRIPYVRFDCDGGEITYLDPREELFRKQAIKDYRKADDISVPQDAEVELIFEDGELERGDVRAWVHVYPDEVTGLTDLKEHPVLTILEEAALSCQHKSTEDCMNCVVCGLCREDVDSSGTCMACGGKDENGK